MNNEEKCKEYVEWLILQYEYFTNKPHKMLSQAYHTLIDFGLWTEEEMNKV